MVKAMVVNTGRNHVIPPRPNASTIVACAEPATEVNTTVKINAATNPVKPIRSLQYCRRICSLSSGLRSHTSRVCARTASRKFPIQLMPE